jgi:hypothetical protein
MNSRIGSLLEVLVYVCYFSDPELPSLIHWAAKSGLPKMTQALMTFPQCQEAAGRLNNQLLNASELAHRHGHLEVAHLLRFDSLEQEQFFAVL